MKAADLEWLAIVLLAAAALLFGGIALRERGRATAVVAAARENRSARDGAGRSAPPRRRLAKAEGEDSVAATRSALEKLAARERSLAFMEWELEVVEQLRVLSRRGDSSVGSGFFEDAFFQRDMVDAPAARRNMTFLSVSRQFLEAIDKYEFMHPLTADERGILEECRDAWRRWKEACEAEQIPAAEFAAAYYGATAAMNRFRSAVLAQERKALDLDGSGGSQELTRVLHWDGAWMSRFTTTGSDGQRVCYVLSSDDRSDE